MRTMTDPAAAGLRRLELILGAIEALESGRPFDERLSDALRLVTDAGVALACGVVRAGAPCRALGAGVDEAAVARAEEAAERAAREGREARRPGSPQGLLALPLRAEGRIEGALWLLGPSLDGPDAALARDLADRLARAAATERARLEQITQARELRRSDALKSALLRGVTHELRSPLAGIANAADALRVVEDPAERDEMLQAVISETQRLERVVSNLLDLSRVEGGVLAARMEWCVPEDLIGAGLQAGAGFLDGVEVVTDVPADAPLVRADPVLTERILVNLLHNAVRHGAPPVRVSGRADGATLEIGVADDGPGVDPAVLPAVFEPFIHREGVGLGLGLPLCRRLAEAQGARLEHRGAPSGGAAFHLVFPLSPAPQVDG
jgi:two-component system sensor histidine kinase KdpD